MLGHRGSLSSTRGVGLFFFAISSVVIMGMAALAIDLGMLLRTRAEAQRAADAAALAGASAFADYPPLADPKPQVGFRAKAVAAKNTMAGTSIVDNEVVGVVACPDPTDDNNPETPPCSTVMMNSAGPPAPAGTTRVFVKIRRANVPTVFFGALLRLLGFGNTASSFPIGATAVAEVGPAGAAKCTQPLFIPDFWDDKNDDKNSNKWPDASENWTWGSEDDYSPAIGLGSDFRNTTVLSDGLKYYRDVGRPFKIWPGAYLPSIDNQWCPGDPDSKCGGNDIATYITDPCSLPPSALGTSYWNKTGVSVGNIVGKGYEPRLTQTDPTGARWVATAPPDVPTGYTTGHVQTTSGDWRDSPRVLLMPFMSPDQLLKGGRQQYVFNNFAWLWLEDVAKGQDKTVTVRFIGLATGGSGGGPSTGSLLKAIRLVR